MDQYEFNPNKQPKEALAAIGVASLSIAQIEDQVRSAIAGLAKIDYELGGAMTTHIPFQTCLDILLTMGNVAFAKPEPQNTLKRLVSALKDANKRRNKLVHRQLATRERDNTLHFIVRSARGSFILSTEKTSVRALQADAAAIYKASMDLQSFISIHKLEPSFEMQRKLKR